MHLILILVAVDKKNNGLKNSGSIHKPGHADTCGPVVLEEDGESSGHDNCEPVDLEKEGQDNETCGSIDNKHDSSLAIDKEGNLP